MKVLSALTPLAFLTSALAAPAPAPQAETTTLRTRPNWRDPRPSTAVAAVPTTTTSSVKWYVAPTSKPILATTSSRPASSTTTTTSRTTTSTTTRAVASSSTTTSSRPASSTVAAPSAAAKKKGTGYNDGALTRNLNLSWAYNWGQVPDGTLNSGVEFVPMLWNDNAGSWATNAQNAINSGSTHLLGFNEPDLDSQANMNVTRAATAWRKYMSPFYGKAKLVSPAVTNGGGTMGRAWLQSFQAACPDCWSQIDAVALHWYDAAWNTGYFTNYLTEAHNMFPDKKIWLTEFAGSGTSAEQQTFLKTVIPWMESQTWLERYAGFGDFVGNYVNADGSLTPLGQVYAST
ncbi:hypothetical protein JCM8097_004207 [Rhodosporidiobolus ruineniae]